MHWGKPNMSTVLKQSSERSVVRTVTGRLSRVDTVNRRLAVGIPGAPHPLECTYDRSIEQVLLDNPRELIQLTGTVTLDAQGRLLGLDDMETIVLLDLSPIVVDSIESARWTLRFREPLVMPVALDDTQQLLCAELGPLHIDAFAFTRAKLVTEIAEQIGMLWQEYAKADPIDLTLGARELRERLLDAIAENPGA